MDEAHLKSKFKAALLGLALGDALGAPLEFMSKPEIALRFGTVREMTGGGWLNLEPGEGTDDTQMTVCLAESLVQKAAFDAEDVLQKFLVWYDTHPKDIGNTTQVALSLLKNNAHRRGASKKAHEILKEKSAGNGSLMRVAPIGLMYHQHEAQLIEASFASSKITHWDALAAESCAAFNLILADFLHGYGQEEAILNAADKIRPRNDLVARSIESVIDKECEALQPTGFVLDTLETSLWHFYHSDSFEEAVVHAVNMGGDADTIGAVTGALSGAYFGPESLPGRWLDVLKGKDLIENLAEKLYEVSIDLDFRP
ncbi:ADP-ribosyl-[dinitrogen reductase] glycohydrolase [bacterium BMS3Abin05]|nr:ADP-ribosyl-[dinitrogen reductase] glycohydrolase [bacterium BMS3Abin05]GBE27917.1 ADP-ribosyl-[dinitrogen reductase] glycohydrolase [bacterium BMS3Bbin03]